MSIELLDDSTLWVSLSFIIFVCITLKPILTQISGSLEKKIDDLKKNIEESKQLKLEAEKLYKDQNQGPGCPKGFSRFCVPQKIVSDGLQAVRDHLW